MDVGVGQAVAVGLREQWAEQVEPHRTTIAGAGREGSQWQAMQIEVPCSPCRYVTRIDTSHPKEDWPRQDELRLFELHNQLGNKWAVIGGQLAGRTDNAVKNHFYSRLRKALKRLNRVIAGLARRELKEVKPNVLYRIVEVAEEKFKEIPKFDREFSLSANRTHPSYSVLKNQLLDYSYEEHEE